MLIKQEQQFLIRHTFIIVFVTLCLLLSICEAHYVHAVRTVCTLPDNPCFLVMLLSYINEYFCLLSGYTTMKIIVLSWQMLKGILYISFYYLIIWLIYLNSNRSFNLRRWYILKMGSMCAIHLLLSIQRTSWSNEPPFMFI